MGGGDALQFVQLHERLGKLLLISVNLREPEVRSPKIRIQGQSLLELYFGLIEAARIEENLAHVMLHDRQRRVELTRPLDFRQTFLEPSLDAEVFRIPMMTGRVFGIELNRAAKLSLRQRPVPVVIHRDQTKSGMRLGKIGIDFQGSTSGGFRFGIGLSAQLRIPRNKLQDIRESGVSLGVVWIKGDRVPEVFFGLGKSLLSARIPNVNSHPISFARGQVRCADSRAPRPWCGVQFMSILA